MKCSKVRKELEQMVYRDGPDPGTEIYTHIDSCKACTQYLEDIRLSASTIAGIRQREPILQNPELLTEEIMHAIREGSKEDHFDMTEKSGKSPVISIVRRLLAAASVCLLLVFGYEEYIVVDKISSLEKQNAMITRSPQYQAALQLDKAMQILAGDPALIDQFIELQKRKVNLRTFISTAMITDVNGITPGALKLMNRTDYNSAIPSFLSFLKQFDSTHYTLQR